MEDAELWCLFESTCCSNKALLRRVLSCLSNKDQSNLRLTNQRLRNAVGGAVDEVTCTLHNGSIKADLAQAFPAAQKLVLDISPLDTDSDSITAPEMYVFIKQVASMNSVLLQQLVHIKIDLVLDGGMTTNVRHAIGSILARCTNLEGMEVVWFDYEDFELEFSPNEAHFLGQGSTPEERRTSMQQQLAHMACSSALLAPASWPTLNCLTQLVVRADFDQQDASVMRSSGLATMSLANLKVEAAQASELVEIQQNFSSLSKLSALSLFADERDSDTSLLHIFEAVACLPGLQYFSCNGCVLDSSAAGGFLPSSWSQLTCLTCLGMYSCIVPLRSLPCLPSLQELTLCHCTTLGELSHVGMLTSLTSLNGESMTKAEAEANDASSTPAGAPSNEAEVGAAPQAWQGNLQQLAWGFSWNDMHVVSQLTSLTWLSLSNAEVGPELCWQLAALPFLRHLELPDARVPEHPPSTLLVSGCRASLPSLNTLQPGSPDSLLQLAMWTDVGLGLALQDDIAFSKDVPLPVNALGAGWLAALAAPHAPAAPAVCPDDEEASAWLALRDAAAVQQLLRQLEGIEPGSKQRSLSLLLGEDVGDEDLGRLLEAAHVFPRGSVHVASANNEVDCEALLGFSVHTHLSSADYCHLHGLSTPGLRMLELDACEYLQDQHVACLATAAPALHVLKLAGACLLTDAALFALVAGRQLEHVAVTGCKGLSGTPVAVLLASLSKLRVLVVGSADVEQVEEALAGWGSSCFALVPPAKRWSVVGADDEGCVECHLQLTDKVLKV